jgi:glutamine amidotransferase
MIGVVDYRAGNAPSVLYALERLGIAARLVGDAASLDAVERIVLPGVGAAAATITSLEESGLVGPLTRRVTEEHVPFLGICIGLQVLFERSEEGPADCLGWVPGHVQRFPDTDRVPQIGWNAVDVARPHPLVIGWPETPYCYFVNSFHAVPADADAVLATTEYSVPFCSMVAAGTIAGLRVLTNFAAWDGAPC